MFSNVLCTVNMETVTGTGLEQKTGLLVKFLVTEVQSINQNVAAAKQTSQVQIQQSCPF